MKIAVGDKITIKTEGNLLVMRTRNSITILATTVDEFRQRCNIEIDVVRPEEIGAFGGMVDG